MPIFALQIYLFISKIYSSLLTLCRSDNFGLILPKPIRMNSLLSGNYSDKKWEMGIRVTNKMKRLSMVKFNNLMVSHNTKETIRFICYKQNNSLFRLLFHY